jgi:DNA-binding GntR family transcriptional regulator
MSGMSDSKGDMVGASTPAAENIAEEIRRAIVSGELAAAAPVTEKWVAEKYSVSRTTIREVLNFLIGEGYLVRRPYHSAQVRSFTEKEVRDIMEARELVEVHAGIRSIAADKASKERLRAALAAYVVAMDSGDVAESSRRHRELHVALVGMCGNERLMKQEEQLMIDSSLFVAVIDSRRDDVEKMKRAHTQLVDAFLEGDQELSVRLVRQHLGMVEKAAIEELEPSPR